MAPPNPGNPAIPPLDDTLGAIEIGGVVGTFLFGIMTLQSFHYFRHFPDDSKLLKYTVTVMWFLELGHTISTWHLIYQLTVTYYGRPQFISSPPDSLAMTIVFSAPIYFIVQVFFANRIRVLSGKWIVTVICWTLTFLRAVCTFGMLAVTLSIPTLADLEIKYQWLMATGLSLGVGVDVIVATSLCYCLWQMRVSSMKRTRRTVDTLIVWTIETGLLTGGTSGMLLVFFFVRDDLTWFPFYLILAKSFSNSLLASLNGRQLLRDSPKVVNLNSEVTSTSLAPTSNVLFELRNVTQPHDQPNAFATSKGRDAESA
ncbi:hypothetical protein DFH06DRAFT_1231676 [Mycena polygramma]|nr:hypothetical protein DFH06DRAFT_1231676 [Mycena polygramma]